MLKPMNESTSIHKIDHISANYSPILKIQNLAYSGVRARSGDHDDDVARDATRAMTSRARRRHYCINIKVTPDLIKLLSLYATSSLATNVMAGHLLGMESLILADNIKNNFFGGKRSNIYAETVIFVETKSTDILY